MITYRIKVSYNEPVEGCLNCPFCYDDLYCVATSDGEKTIYSRKEAPVNCPLKIYEESEGKKNV